MRIALLFISLYCLCLTVFATDKKNIVAYDSSTNISIKKASPEKEKEIFSDKDFVYHKEAKESKSWWERFVEWLMRLLGRPVAKHPVTSFKILKYILVGLFIFGVIFALWKSKFIGLLKGDAKKLSGASFADIPEDIEDVNIDKFIDEALQKGNYRLALRWCFLKSLQWLNKHNKITWKPSKTNIDYQKELNDRSLKDGFAGLSNVFEYVWYGEINPTEKLCAEYKSKVEKFISSPHV